MTTRISITSTDKTPDLPDTEAFPVVTSALISALKVRFAPPVLTRNTTREDILIMVGHREVIEFLESISRNQ